MHGKASDAPLEDTVGSAAGDEAVGRKQSDGVVGENAVPAAALGNDLAFAEELGNPLLRFLQRDVDGAG